MFGKDFLLLIDRGVSYAAISGATEITGTLATIEVAANNASVAAGTAITGTLATIELATYTAAIKADVNIDGTTGTIVISANDATVTTYFEELPQLQVRARSIGGRDKAIEVDVVRLMTGDDVRYNLPLAHVLPTGITVADANEVANKHGAHVILTALAVDYTATDVVLSVETSGTDTGGAVCAVQLDLSNGDLWEINVPVWVD